MLLVAALVLVLAYPAKAAEFTVNSTNDFGNGTCDASECTLREAIGASNSSPEVEVEASSTAEAR